VTKIATAEIHREAEKRNYSSVMNKSFNMQYNLANFSVINMIVDVTYLIYGIYTNFCRLLCKKCDVG